MTKLDDFETPQSVGNMLIQTQVCNLKRKDSTPSKKTAKFTENIKALNNIMFIENYKAFEYSAHLKT